MARKNQKAPWEPEEEIIWVSKSEMKADLTRTSIMYQLKLLVIMPLAIYGLKESGLRDET